MLIRPTFGGAPPGGVAAAGLDPNAFFAFCHIWPKPGILPPCDAPREKSAAACLFIFQLPVIPATFSRPAINSRLVPIVVIHAVGVLVALITRPAERGVIKLLCPVEIGSARGKSGNCPT